MIEVYKGKESHPIVSGGGETAVDGCASVKECMEVERLLPTDAIQLQ